MHALQSVFGLTLAGLWLLLALITLPILWVKKMKLVFMFAALLLSFAMTMSIAKFPEVDAAMPNYSSWERLPGNAERYLSEFGCPSIIWKDQQGNIVRAEYTYWPRGTDLICHIYLETDVPAGQPTWAERYLNRETKNFVGYPQNLRLHLHAMPDVTASWTCVSEVRSQ